VEEDSFVMPTAEMMGLRQVGSPLEELSKEGGQEIKKSRNQEINKSNKESNKKDERNESKSGKNDERNESIEGDEATTSEADSIDLDLPLELQAPPPPESILPRLGLIWVNGTLVTRDDADTHVRNGALAQMQLHEGDAPVESQGQKKGEIYSGKKSNKERNRKDERNESKKGEIYSGKKMNDAIGKQKTEQVRESSGSQGSRSSVVGRKAR